LKVGELARSSGLTVRTLHHYDEIGLLKPSVRKEAGYRLYSVDDVGRLHAIQALRHLGLPLADIGALLDGQATAPAIIIEQPARSDDVAGNRAARGRECAPQWQAPRAFGRGPAAFSAAKCVT
jgi:DNA-binding transcriptional MerR regulator